MRPDDRVTELEEERDFLLRSIEDLEAEHAAGDLEDDDYRALEEDYTARAAAVLRRLQHLDSPAGPPPTAGDDDAPPRAAASPRPAGRRVRWPMLLTVVATVALAAGSGYLVTRSSGERRPDQGVSGGPDSSAGTLLQEAVDLDNAGKLVQAAKLYDAVLAQEPENIVAITRRGWVLGRSGRQAGNTELLQDGLGYLDRATQLDPTFADAHAFRGLVLGALGRPGEAGCEFRLWLAVAPIADPLRPEIEGVLDEATKQAGGTLPECPKLPVPTPVGPGPAAGPSPTIAPPAGPSTTTP